MAAHRIGRIVAGSLASGLATALALVIGPAAGAEEHVIMGSVLLAFASSWALLAMLAGVLTRQLQRWAVLPAAFMGVWGAGLLAFAPGGDTIDALGWVWPPLLIMVLVVAAVRARRELRSRTRAWVVYPLLGLYGLGAVGGSLQTIRESLGRRDFAAPGQMVDVGGHRLHLDCAGSGAPTVILESGLGATAASWALISSAIANDTRVCAYDRAGRGWSDPSSAPNDGVAAATELHVLLQRAQVPGPFILVGHSSGANYVRIFTGRYPEQVAGVVLLDGQPAEAFEGLPAFAPFYARYRRVFAVLPSLARLGVGRFVFRDAFKHLPEPARSMERFSHSSARLWRSLHREFMELPTSLQQARSFQSIGGRPLVVVTAAVDAMVGWLPLQDELATLSTNSSHRVVPFTHDELVSNDAGTEVSSEAIRDVVRAVRAGVSLKKQ